jgi:hypothetical protein
MPAWTLESVRDEAIAKRQTAIPAMPIYSPDDTNASEILSITGSFFAVAAIVVLLRCYVRISMLKVFGIDDYLMVVALVCILQHYSFGASMLICSDSRRGRIRVLQAGNRLWAGKTLSRTPCRPRQLHQNHPRPLLPFAHYHGRRIDGQNLNRILLTAPRPQTLARILSIRPRCIHSIVHIYLCNDSCLPVLACLSCLGFSTSTPAFRNWHC